MVTHEKTRRIRQRIVHACDDLLYHKGYNRMSFSDIAKASGIPRGNLNYYFKTKQQVLDAVIEHRLGQAREMLDEWDRAYPKPLERLKRYARIPFNERENVSRFGCPMGSLNTELGKQQRELQAVSRMQFDLFREWLARQFQAWLPGQDADALSLHLLARTQGLAVLAHAYADPLLPRHGVDDIHAWLESLERLG